MKGQLKMVVLMAIVKQNHSGYSLMQYLKQNMGWKPSPGSLYPLLNSLFKNKLISMNAEGNKKIYSITKKGKEAVQIIIKSKGEFLNSMKKNLKVFEQISDKQESKFMIEMFERLQKGHAPFSWLTKEAIELREVMFSKSKTVKNEKTQMKIKKVINDVISKIKKIK